MRAFKIILAVTLISLWGVLAKADKPAVMDDNNNQTLESVLKDIRQSQNVKSNDQIDCEKVTDKQFEGLGEAYMDVMHPDPKEHAILDRMMGGGNSESLATMHRMMGARYLGCYKGGVMGDYGMGMMGGNIMAGQQYGPWTVLHNHHGWNMMNQWLGGWPMWLFLIILIAVIIYAFAQNKKSVGGAGSESALDILRKRFARGEISKDEFERMKKDLQS